MYRLKVALNLGTTCGLSEITFDDVAIAQQHARRGSVLKFVYLARSMRFQILKRRSAR